MIPVGERISGSFADVRAAILAKDAKLVQWLALMQKDAEAALEGVNFSKIGSVLKSLIFSGLSIVELSG